MAPLRGRAPHGRWRTQTFLAGLRCDRIKAPCVFDSPINGQSFLAYVKQVLVPTSKPGDGTREAEPNNEPRASLKIEPNQDALCATEINLDTPISAGIMDSRDLDYFRFKTGAGAKTLTVKLENRSAMLRPKLNLYDPNKVNLSERCISTPGANLVVEEKAQPESTYYIRVGNYNNETDGEYSLTATVK